MKDDWIVLHTQRMRAIELRTCLEDKIALCRGDLGLLVFFKSFLKALLKVFGTFGLRSSRIFAKQFSRML